jgi:hypothetical protein
MVILIIMVKPRVSKKTKITVPSVELSDEPSEELVQESIVEPSIETVYVPSVELVSELVQSKLYETQQQKERILDTLKTTVETMDKTHHVEFLKRIVAFGGGVVNINENRNGVYINLSYLPDPLIRELYDLVQYTNKQETILNIDEASKDLLKREFFVQDLPRQALF